MCDSEVYFDLLRRWTLERSQQRLVKFNLPPLFADVMVTHDAGLADPFDAPSIKPRAHRI